MFAKHHPKSFPPYYSFHYALKDAQIVRIDIYNVKDQVIRSFSSANKAAGEHFQTWDGTEDIGKAVASRIFFYRLIGKDYTNTKKMRLVKQDKLTVGKTGWGDSFCFPHLHFLRVELPQHSQLIPNHIDIELGMLWQLTLRSNHFA